MLSALFLFGEYRIYNIIVSNIKTHAASSHATINQLSILSPMPPFGGSNRYEKRCPLRFSCVRLSTSPRNSLCCEWKLPQAVRSTSHTNSHLPRFAKSQIKIVKLNFHAKISNKSPRISSTFASIAILSHSSLTSAWANSSNFSSTSRIMP